MNLDAPNDRDLMVAGLLRQGTYDDILRSTVRLARLTFSAAAASVFLYDGSRQQLVFEASSGAGEDRLVGAAVPADRGIAGWVFHSGETVIVDEVATDPRFNLEFAAGTGYVPRSVMAAPLEFEDTPIGVLEVLDPARDRFGDMTAIDLLTELAVQSAGALSLLVAVRMLSPGNGSSTAGRADWDMLELALASGRAPQAAVHDLLQALVALVDAPFRKG